MVALKYPEVFENKTLHSKKNLDKGIIVFDEDRFLELFMSHLDSVMADLVYIENHVVYELGYKEVEFQ